MGRAGESSLYGDVHCSRKRRAGWALIFHGVIESENKMEEYIFSKTWARSVCFIRIR